MTAHDAVQFVQHLDLVSLAVGAGVSRSLEAAIVQAVKRGPRLLVGLVRRRLQKLAAEGCLDGTTMSLLKAYAQATFEWIDAELPLLAGPAKMEAALDRLAALPYLGVLIRADRAGVKQILQAAYDAIDAEAKEEARVLKGEAPTPPIAKPNPAAENTIPLR